MLQLSIFGLICFDLILVVLICLLFKTRTKTVDIKTCINCGGLFSAGNPGEDSIYGLDMKAGWVCTTCLYKTSKEVRK